MDRRRRRLAVDGHARWRCAGGAAGGGGTEAGPVRRARREDLSRAHRRETGGSQLLVKWKGLSHIHCQWVPQRSRGGGVEQAEGAPVLKSLRGGCGRRRLLTWELGDADDGRGGPSEEEPTTPTLSSSSASSPAPAADGEDVPPRFLVKWRCCRPRTRRGSRAHPPLRPARHPNLSSLWGLLAPPAQVVAQAPPAKGELQEDERSPSTRAGTRCGRTN